MAFLFKSRKNQERVVTSREGTSSQQSTNGRPAARDDKSAAPTAANQHRATPTGSVHSIDNDGSVGTPEQNATHVRRGGSLDQVQPSQPQSDLPFRNGPPVSNPNASLYPWSQRRFTYTSSHPSPFPRYGAAVNSLSSKEGDIYMMGGLINSSTVKGDLWMIEAGGNMACYPLATTSEGPGPRVGHSSLLVGNAFIVYGGDTKIDESDVLDETLYLLNTSTRQWSRALPAGPRPAGRYGHSLNILGSKIFVFGGQVEGYFMNDLAAFDLNQLQMPNNRWEMLTLSDAAAKAPAARTNHSMITYNDQMYLFGGTNGFKWFNDVWCFDPSARVWNQLDCIGYIPAPREGHASALVDDVMYIFGGRTEEGTDLGDLAAFKISTRRWYTFQNMGPSPSPRSGHSMTTVGKSVVVLGGEPSSAASAINDLGILYVLDTTKIRYPTDAPKTLQGRRPSTGESGNYNRPGPRDGSNPPDTRRVVSPTQNLNGAPSGYRSPVNGMESNGQAPAGAVGPKIARASVAPSPGPPPQGPTPAKPTMEPSAVGRVRGPSADRAAATASPNVVSSHNSPISREPISREPISREPISREPISREPISREPISREPISREPIAENEVLSTTTNGRRTPTQQPPAKVVAAPEVSINEVAKAKSPKLGRTTGSTDSSTEPGLKMVANRPASPPPPTRQPSNPINRRSSGRNSQTVALLKELDSARNRNAWYASELELARKTGYVANASLSPALDSKSVETFDDEDRPLIEALLAMRTELANVQSAVDKQAISAARQIAEVEKQRDAAIQEAIYAKAKLSSLHGDLADSSSQQGRAGDDSVRSSDISRKLASALHLQKDLQSRLDTIKSELETEKKGRQLAEETCTAAEKRMTGLESYKQQTSAEVERLKAELHLAQREAREQAVHSTEMVGQLALLKVEKDDLDARYDDAVGSSKDHHETFGTLRAAITSTEQAKAHLEVRLEEERAERERIEDKFNKLKGEHEARTTELVTATQRLRDAEDLAEKHASEAKAHRAAIVSGLDKLSTRSLSAVKSGEADRAAALQSQVVSLNSLVKKYQQEADTAADKLRSAEERIAGLEQYQEQSSREGVSVRRQLQSSLREIQGLQATHVETKSQLAAQQLETNAMSVQHSALKNILAERGISPTGAVRSRNASSSRNNSPEMTRVRELEAQLAGANSSLEEAKHAFAFQTHESETAYREKLSQLESDYQSAVHYVKGTEKMLKQLKEQLSRYKTENGRLKNELVDLEDQMQEDGRSSTAPADWEAERHNLESKVEQLESEMRSSSNELNHTLTSLKTELQATQRQRDEAMRSGEAFSSRLEEFEQLQTENVELEQRAREAEQKVSLLLDQVENSVDNYRRQSRQAVGPNPEAIVNGAGSHHTRNESSDVESVGMGARNSAALDNLASELETLRTHWEATNKNYRMSNNFDFDPPAAGNKPNDSNGLSESLADWRKRLDTDEAASAKMG